MPLFCFFLPDHSRHCATYASKIWAIRNNMHPAYHRWTERQQFCLHEAFGYHCLVKSSFKALKRSPFCTACWLLLFLVKLTGRWCCASRLMPWSAKKSSVTCCEVFICSFLLSAFIFSAQYLLSNHAVVIGLYSFGVLAIWEVCFLLAK